MKHYFIFLRDLFLNIFFSYKYDLLYVVENANWSTDWDGKNITKNLNELKFIKSKIISTHMGLRKKIIHFGSVSTFVTKNGLKNVHKSNKIVLTWFHVVSDDKRLKFIDDINERVDIIHTSCEITKNKLIQNGINPQKIVVIPIGVDLNIFKPIMEGKKEEIRKSLNISDDTFVIGSFQKDGNGWGKGDNPKLIKGPDIFCDVIEKLSLKHKIHVLLTGPARGYVINRLIKARIPYTHVYLKNFYDIAPYYQILDLYLICSREEGGPKAILECMACGVPLVSTRVGMVPEIIKNSQNGFVVDIDDINNLYEKSNMVITDSILKNQLIDGGLKDVKNYDYKSISLIYWEKIYSKLLIK